VYRPNFAGAESGVGDTSTTRHGGNLLIEIILRERTHPEQGFRASIGILRHASAESPFAPSRCYLLGSRVEHDLDQQPRAWSSPVQRVSVAGIEILGYDRAAFDITQFEHSASAFLQIILFCLSGWDEPADARDFTRRDELVANIVVLGATIESAS
jgi:hypothetical protein